MLGMAKLIRAPLFFLAVGSQANIGGAASEPVVATAFHPSLAPVGVLLAVMGYALGTSCAYRTGVVLQAMAAWGGGILKRTRCRDSFSFFRPELQAIPFQPPPQPGFPKTRT